MKRFSLIDSELIQDHRTMAMRRSSSDHGREESRKGQIDIAGAFLPP